MNHTSLLPRFCLLTLLAASLCARSAAENVPNESLTACTGWRVNGRSLHLTTSTGQRVRITPYGNSIIRVQTVRSNEEFFPDDHYEMVESHHWGGFLSLSDSGSFLLIRSAGRDGIVLRVNKTPLRLSFFSPDDASPVLAEGEGIRWEGGEILESFLPDPREHFTGLGHGFYGQALSLDLQGSQVQRNYGSAHGQQAPLIVPFYLSSKGYGLFVNSTFPNSFTFDRDGVYGFSLIGEARMDYFFIHGPKFSRIMDLYTQLTGRPRFPPLAMFGLSLSDKANDHTSADPSDELWWKRKVTEHRRAGFPIDHLINDNRWRAGGGKRCESNFEWDTTRFPDPAEYERWLKSSGLVVTIDFNRCIASKSDGWKESFNVADAREIEFGGSAPDFTRADVRAWFWGLHWRKSLDPALSYPGDALWIDEFDEMGKAPDSMLLGNGRSWLEMKDYWFFLIAKALVQEGWDKDIGETRRPFVWVRGMTAGAQRFATLWSGDIRPTDEEMRMQIRGMQLAGMSGFPYWGHDAGGYYDPDRRSGPDDDLYGRWSMAFGSFSPFWKPHGMGASRWPLDRSPAAQEIARVYASLRYHLMPYTYTYAHEAHEHGTPIARPMIFEHQDDPRAWTHELQYMWGREMLIAPNCSGDDSVTVWLPVGAWYEFWNDSLWHGDQVVRCPSPGSQLPVFVRAGSVIPMAPPAIGTGFIPRDTLLLHVYTRTDGSFVLYEDDGVTEAFDKNGEKRFTEMIFLQSAMQLTIGPSTGSFAGAPASRTIRVEFHGLPGPVQMEANDRILSSPNQGHPASLAGDFQVWSEKTKCLSVVIRNVPVARALVLRRATGRPDGDPR